MAPISSSQHHFLLCVLKSRRSVSNVFRHIKCALFLSKLASAAFDSEPLLKKTFPGGLPLSVTPHTVRPLTKNLPLHSQFPVRVAGVSTAHKLLPSPEVWSQGLHFNSVSCLEKYDNTTRVNTTKQHKLWNEFSRKGTKQKQINQFIKNKSISKTGSSLYIVTKWSLKFSPRDTAVWMSGQNEIAIRSAFQG